MVLSCCTRKGRGDNANTHTSEPEEVDIGLMAVWFSSRVTIIMEANLVFLALNGVVAKECADGGKKYMHGEIVVTSKKFTIEPSL